MFQETIVLSLVYILIVAIAFSPKCPQVSPDRPIDYFPVVEADPEPAIASNPSVTDLASIFTIISK
jgi:hypothetical protein